NIEDYLDNRFYPQLEWYEKHAKISRYEFYLCQAVIVIVSALIPIINVSVASDYIIKLFSSVFGAIIIVATAVLQLTKAYENWINYRSTAEQLKQEYQLFALEASKYSDEELGNRTTNKDSKEKLFIMNVELLIESEGKKFLSIMSKRSSESNARNT
ncbi:MAG TPA: DUF4231 domain-containing protein, partial [Nitrososphaeraceae archaeon]|nr:DUF4231 domain-containing protein [Nitrososphaeraceae archaeon]